MWERRAIATAEELDFPSGPFSSAFVTVYLAWIRMITGDLDEAREFGRRTIEIAERCRFDYFQLLGGQYVLVPEPDQPCDVTELEHVRAGDGPRRPRRRSARRTSASSPRTTTTSATPTRRSARSRKPWS